VELVASATDSLVALEAAQCAPAGANAGSEPSSEENWAWVIDTLHQAPADEPQQSTVNE
jgi:hypothetical protein